MPDIDDRDDMSDMLKERVGESFQRPVVDAATRESVVATARTRVAGSRPAARRRWFARGLAVAAVALVVLVVLWLQPARGPLGKQVTTASAANVLFRAKAAISKRDIVLHVVATTDTTDLPIPEPPRPAKPVTPVPPAQDLASRPSYSHGGPAMRYDPLVLDRTVSEHWLDQDGKRRVSREVHTQLRKSGAWNRALVEMSESNGVVLNVSAMRGSSWPATSTTASRNSANDLSGAFDWSVLPSRDIETPDQQLRDTSDPGVYYGLLSGGSLKSPPGLTGKVGTVSTSATLLGRTKIRGVEAYELQIVSSATYPEPAIGTGVDTTVVADIRASDYLPVQVAGRYSYFHTDNHGKKVEDSAGQEWVTHYRTVALLKPTQVPQDAFRVDVPRGTVVKSNLALAPKQVRPSAGFGVKWLGPRFAGLRFTGRFHDTSHSGEYQSMLIPDGAAELTDQSRPALSTRQVIAEYTPDGRASNATTDIAAVSLKIISMPHVDSKKWQPAFKAAQSTFPGDWDKYWVTSRSWTTVNGVPALLLHHQVKWGNGTPSGYLILTMDYIVFDAGNSTILVQGADTKPGLVKQAAETLIRAN